MNYIVKAKNIMVLKKKDLVIKETQRKLKDKETVWDHIPESFVTGNYINVTVSNGQSLNDNEYEPRRLYELAKNGYLEAINDDGKIARPKPPEKTEDEKEIEQIIKEKSNYKNKK